MTSLATCLLTLTIFASTLIVVGQTASNPILVDEFSLLGCEDFGSHIDSWISESNRAPHLQPIALVAGPQHDLLGRITYREWIKGQLLFRFKDTADRDWFTILEGGLNDTLRVELWLANTNDRTLARRESRWNLSLPMMKPKAYYQSEGDGGICPFIDRTTVFKQLIEANRTLNGRVIFHTRNMNEFLKQKAEFLAKIPNVDARRFSFARPSRSSTFYDGHFEYWFVPTRKSH